MSTSTLSDDRLSEYSKGSVIEDESGELAAMAAELLNLRSKLHHWNKYHNANFATAFLGGHCYLGDSCVACEFGDSDREAKKIFLSEAGIDP